MMATPDTPMEEEDDLHCVTTDPGINIRKHEYGMGFYQKMNPKKDEHYKIFCMICEKTIRNASINNMESHRNTCLYKAPGVFLVLKTDMINNDAYPPIWKIEEIYSEYKVLKKYIPFEEDGNIWYKDTTINENCMNSVDDQHYYAPVSLNWHKRKTYLRFHKEKVNK